MVVYSFEFSAELTGINVGADCRQCEWLTGFCKVMVNQGEALVHRPAEWVIALLPRVS